ncbi:MAG: tRNA-dihydrouridine synthase family protein [Candidatus Absconditabacterales bacterium]|nr:tRNA-dihydrouridine synthase family protein [Candidatus Absconditabacterales bacterium]
MSSLLCCLAPMDGFTDAACRSIFFRIRKQYGNHTKTQYKMRTEFMNADGYLRQPSRIVHHLLSCSDTPYPIVQIYGGNRETLVEACHDICRKYPFFPGIELNIGCPSPSVMSCEAGAGMMKDKAKTLETVKQMSEACATYGMPFSIKTRLGLTSNDKQDQIDFIHRAVPYCSMISVHARTFKQGHSGDVDRETLYQIKEHFGDTITLIGNGGITSRDDMRSKAKNLDGIMIAQAAIANPWIFTPHIPTPQDRYDIIKDHFLLMLGQEHWMNEQKKILTDDPTSVLMMPSTDELRSRGVAVKQSYADQKLFSVLEYRKHLFGYLKTLVGAKDLKVKLATITDPNHVSDALDEFFCKLSVIEMNLSNRGESPIKKILHRSTNLSHTQYSNQKHPHHFRIHLHESSSYTETDTSL